MPYCYCRKRRNWVGNQWGGIRVKSFPSNNAPHAVVAHHYKKVYKWEKARWFASGRKSNFRRTDTRSRRGTYIIIVNGTVCVCVYTGTEHAVAEWTTDTMQTTEAKAQERRACVYIKEHREREEPVRERNMGEREPSGPVWWRKSSG